jgi:hypothetical protein
MWRPRRVLFDSSGVCLFVCGLWSPRAVLLLLLHGAMALLPLTQLGFSCGFAAGFAAAVVTQSCPETDYFNEVDQACRRCTLCGPSQVETTPCSISSNRLCAG